MHGYVHWHAVGGDFRYPPSRVPGSTANEEWHDFQEWMSFRMPGFTVPGLEFRGLQPARHLAQCTIDLWMAQHEELRIRVSGGPEHRLRPPESWGWSRYAVLPPEDGGLDGMMLVDDLGLGVGGWEDRGHMPPQVDPREFADPAEDRQAERIDALIRDAGRRYRPLPLLVPRDATMEWLDTLLSRFEERGVRWFALTFYGGG